MKHCLFVFLPIFILFISCRQKVQSNFQPDISSQTETVYDFPEEYAEEIIITGKVLNREFYPQEKELTLIIPFFRDMENQYRTPIQEDGSFYFTFPVYAKIREVSIRNYAEHLYVHPGDSIHLEIDFKDMFHPKVTGDTEKLNQEILAFTESGYYYMRDYGIRHDLSVEDFEAELKKEYDTRLERRAEYLQKYNPMQDVVMFTEELLKQDYYYTILVYASQCQYRTRKEFARYHTLLPEINKLYKKGILSARLFDIVDWIENYIPTGMVLKNKEYPTIDDIMSEIGENELNQYLYTKVTANSLEANDTISLSRKRSQFDSIVKIPHLQGQIAQVYRQTKAFLENPQSVSDNLLYGKYNESSNTLTPMSYMESIYKILEENRGKVIYLDFWATTCPPCLAEMEPLKKLRSQYSTKDLIIYSICSGGNDTKKQWELCLDKYSMKNHDIECVYAADYIGLENYQKITKQFKINRLPYYILINRKGQIVDYGTVARPSNPNLLLRIEEIVKQ